MEHDPVHNARSQNGMRDARTHVNRQKGDGIEPPRTVAEQLDELVTQEDGDGRRRRDPLAAAQAQQAPRDNGVGGAWIDTSQRANEAFDDIMYEKLPNRHEERAERLEDS